MGSWKMTWLQSHWHPSDFFCCPGRVGAPSSEVRTSLRAASDFLQSLQGGCQGHGWLCGPTLSLQPPWCHPGCLYLSDGDLLQADHLGAAAHPAGQGHLQDFAVICEGSGRRICQGWEHPRAGGTRVPRKRWQRSQSRVSSHLCRGRARRTPGSPCPAGAPAAAAAGTAH